MTWWTSVKKWFSNDEVVPTPEEQFVSFAPVADVVEEPVVLSCNDVYWNDSEPLWKDSEPVYYYSPISDMGSEDTVEQPLVPVVPVVDNDTRWFNLEILKLAFDLEKNARQKTILYVDVKGLTKKAAEAHIKTYREQYSLWHVVPRQGPSAVEVSSPGIVTFDDVLDTAERLKEFLAGE